MAMQHAPAPRTTLIQAPSVRPQTSEGQVSGRPRQVSPRAWTGLQSGGMDRKMSDALHTEFLELRASIRNDLREELCSALAETGRPKADSPRQDESGSLKYLVARRPVQHTPPPPACDDVEVLRLSAKVDELNTPSEILEGWQGTKATVPSPIQPGKPRKVKVGFSSGKTSMVSYESSSLASQPWDSKAEKGDFLQQSVVAAVKRAAGKSALRKSQSSQEPADSTDAFWPAARKGLTMILRQGKSVRKTKSFDHSGMLEQAKKDEHLSCEEVLELVTLVAIVLNGIVFGVQTEYQATNRTEDVPLFILIAEIAFFFIFAGELLMRLYKERRAFLFGAHYTWNIFDTLLVLLQFVDILLELTKIMSDGRALQLGFLRLLRILRILRALRLVRLVKFFGEMNVVSSAIANSIKSLAGTIMLLFLIIYIFAIAFAGAANSYLVRLLEAGTSIDANPVHVWWSSLGRTVLSLYEAVLGGVDWDELMQGLFEIHMGWAILFMCYISFMMLTMLNVITGIFVDSAVKHAAQYQEKSFATQMRRLFETTDLDDTGTISRRRFECEMRKPEFAWFMQEVGIEPREARLLFDLLDLDKSNDIELEEFLAGMVRLRAGARFIDIMNLQHALERHMVGDGDGLMRWQKSLAQRAANQTSTISLQSKVRESWSASEAGDD